MYKVKHRKNWAGPGICHRPGDILDVPDSLGRHLVDSGSASLIEIITERVIESTVIQPPENAMMPKPRAGRKARR